MKNITIINQKPYRLVVDNINVKEYNVQSNHINIDELIDLPALYQGRHVIYYGNADNAGVTGITGAAILLVGNNHDDVNIKENIDIDNIPLNDIYVINAEYIPKRGGLVVKRVQEIIIH
jgi:hypothetical protein